MKTLILTFMFMSICYATIGQTQTLKTEQVTSKTIVIQKPSNTIKVISSQGYQAEDNIALKSDYNNWESEILNKLNIDYIPQNFPKYISSMTDENYMSLITNWANNNQTLVKH